MIRRKELEYLMDLGMISVDDDNLDYVIKALKHKGYKVRE